MSTDPFETDAIGHVVLAIDGSENSLRAQRWAMGIARFWEAKVTVVCGFDSPKSIRKRASVVLPEVRDEMEAEAREIVAEAVAELRAAGVQVEGIAYEGSPEDAVLSVVEEHGPDVIVAGFEGGRGARDYMVGSAVERIVRHSPIPVLVIK